MPNIEEYGYPLAFKMPLGVSQPPIAVNNLEEGVVATRVHVRALEGMQKEAVVTMASSAGEQTWRMVSDEGPYLDGTDLAPFPLAFFSAGLQFSFLSEIMRHTREQGVTLQALALSQDTFYTMNGSALQGTMIGGAKPVEVKVRIESDAAPETIAHIVSLARQTSPAHILMQNILSNVFSLSFNDKELAVTEVNPSSEWPAYEPEAVFAQVHPVEAADFQEGIITKLTTAERIEGVEGGASSSLKPIQKRTLQIHGEAKLLEGTLLETIIQLRTPIGSTFRFLCDAGPDDGPQKITPSPMTFLSTGVGFCFMTQIGRYAHITKQALQGYQIIQDNIYKTGEMVQVLPFNTRTFIQADEADEVAQKTLSMSERTCFLHAAMRGSYPSVITAQLNGTTLPLPDPEA